MMMKKAMRVNKSKGYFSISAVAKMFSVHQQTIRLYEKEGLINPKRSEGNTRLFCPDDVNRLEEVIYLTHQMGINLAGVQVILKLKKQIAKMQKDMNKLFDQTKQELDKESEQSKEIVKATAKQLLKLKQQSILDVSEVDVSEAAQEINKQITDIDNWEIEYEEDD